MTVHRNIKLKKELENQIKHYVKKCQKIPCHMRDSACMWFIARKAKVF